MEHRARVNITLIAGHRLRGVETPVRSELYPLGIVHIVSLTPEYSLFQLELSSLATNGEDESATVQVITIEQSGGKID